MLKIKKSQQFTVEYMKLLKLNVKFGKFLILHISFKNLSF